MIARGGITDAITATRAAPPPRPNAAEMAEVRRLRRHRATNDHSVTPGALARMSLKTNMKSRPVYSDPPLKVQNRTCAS